MFREWAQMAAAALTEAEQRLRDIAAKAAAAGQYDELDRIISWARQVAAIAAEGSARENSNRTAQLRSPNQRAHRRADGTSGPQGAYPRFARESDFLVKTGFSKKNQSEYQHKVPATAVFSIAKELAGWRPTMALVSVERITKDYSERHGQPIPYQVYAALGWLSSEQLVRRHGRSGYSVPSPQTLEQDARQAWGKLKDSR